jgi:hypothetical protein
MKDLGKITFGKARPAPKQLKKDQEAVIQYVIAMALRGSVKK